MAELIVDFITSLDGCASGVCSLPPPTFVFAVGLDLLSRLDLDEASWAMTKTPTTTMRIPRPVHSARPPAGKVFLGSPTFAASDGAGAAASEPLADDDVLSRRNWSLAVPPRTSESPSPSLRSVETETPLTVVPFRLPRSLNQKPSAFCSMMA